MRISDWSSDVCSSDLWSRIAARTQAPVVAPAVKNGHSPVARASAPVGAAFTLIALATGSLWGKQMWGTWWALDARLTSFLKIGRASCRERGCQFLESSEFAVSVKNTIHH